MTSENDDLRIEGIHQLVQVGSISTILDKALNLTRLQNSFGKPQDYPLNWGSIQAIGDQRTSPPTALEEGTLLAFLSEKLTDR